MSNTTKDTDDETMSDGRDEDNVSKDVKEQPNDESEPMEQVLQIFIRFEWHLVLLFYLTFLFNVYFCK